MIEDLAYILVVAGIVTLLFKKLKQPLVLGYIVAGFLVSPNMQYTKSVAEVEHIEIWAQIGVIFLLFSLGLEFSFKKIVKMGVAPIISAITIVGCMLLTGCCVGHLFGWGRMDCIFLGGMLAMSSTTIIYKALDDLGLRQQHFASLVMSVLILEDILAIVMMVMLSAIATGGDPDSGQMIFSILKIAFMLIVWFVIGIFAVPAFLRKSRPIMTQETLLIVSLGMCCLMAVISTKVGFSEAFGAFVMGSILAETVEAEKIEKTIEPVKNLFGAIFFVSVGMLVDPNVLISYAFPIFVIVLTIICGQAVFGTLGFFLGGEQLRSAMRCGFSMAQIGEFAFIIASLGLSLGVIADFLYPVVVAVSVITTFLTPYMIKASEPAYHMLEKRLPKSFILFVNSLHSGRSNNKKLSTDTPTNTRQYWTVLLKDMLVNTIVYGILIVTITFLMTSFGNDFLDNIMPELIADIITIVITLILVSPFMRALMIKKNKSEEWRYLWRESPLNRLPLISTIVARAALCLLYVFTLCSSSDVLHVPGALLVCIAIIIIVLVILSRQIKRRSIGFERMFLRNLHSRDMVAQAQGLKQPKFAEKLLDRDIHIASVNIPEDSTWAGKTLANLDLGRHFGVHVSSIIRGTRRINIPGGDEIIFPSDRLNVIGTDAQLKKMIERMEREVYQDESRIEDNEMVLHQIIVDESTPFLGKMLRESGLRDIYGFMVVGIDNGEEDLTPPTPNYVFTLNDVVWVVGERNRLNKYR